MSAALGRKPRMSVEVVPSLVTLPERVSVVETKVDNIEEKIGDVKETIKGIEHSIETHNTAIKEQLDTMYDASCTQHAELNKKIGDLEKFKNKWMYLIIGGAVVLSWSIGHMGFFSKLL